MKNYRMANKGRLFELEIERSNSAYKNRKIALVDQIPVPWKVQWSDGRIVSAYPEKKSTVDFKGTLNGGIPFSFDAKESEDERGLPLKHIQPHQVEYLRIAQEMGEAVFILCFMKKLNKRFFICGHTLFEYWDYWQANKGKRGINFIAIQDMREIVPRDGILLDYLEGMYER